MMIFVICAAMWLAVGAAGILSIFKLLKPHGGTHPIEPFVLLYLSLFGPVWFGLLAFETVKELIRKK